MMFQYFVIPSGSSYVATLRKILTEMQESGIETVLGCSFYKLCPLLVKIAKDMDYNLLGIMFAVCISGSQLNSDLGRDAGII